ncbi:iron(III) dicitrate transport ATP-binding protein FecE [Treponema primitia ZAS-2]|uniref:Iron(III) dicitrate transport ATP-binding protein FecE n=1 Tax=Treponema primitia (strain ATCC BAA-887 / DSM 12427 / ZAS-2) TaxID=545694 RepID=F5YMZ3_TREPZ|nr:ABC transporter substrate-binding protein [Treponema primitia]AEF84983.1 iron(III) dicitrate transport ATP-binding protein FecE [Treponema primitia ZAS-2]
MLKKKIIPGVALVVILFSAVSCGAKKQNTPDRVENEEKGIRTITDLAGRTVKVPINPERVAPLVGPGYEKIILLGEVDKVAVTGNRMAVTSWAPVIAPAYKNKPVINSATEPNIEELVGLGVDVVFYWDSYPDVIAKLDEVGIPVVVTQLGNGNPGSIDEFIRFQKEEVLLFGEVLGDKAFARANEWCTFFDEKVNFIRSRVASLRADQKPDVYYVRGPDALTIHGRNSYTMWLVELAGGNLVSKNSQIELLYTTTMEDVVKWNPEYVFMGRVNSTDIITKDPAWSGIRAVRENKVLVNPKGIMMWDYSSEGLLLMEFIAKTLHPDLFPDLDIRQEIKEYFKRFYGYTLSDDEADRIYHYQDPA